MASLPQEHESKADEEQQAQTPEQRKRNAKFTKEQNAKRGKPAQELKKKQEFKSPVSPMVLGKSPSRRIRNWFRGRMLIFDVRYSWIRRLWRSAIRIAQQILPFLRE